MGRSFDRFIIYFVEVLMKDIQIVDIDYTGKNPLYKRTETVDLTKISGYWIVPGEGPFYGDDLRVLKGGLDVTAGSFKAVEPVTDLTDKTGRATYLYIELSSALIASGGSVQIIYQQVGRPVISVKELLDLLEEMTTGGGTANWQTQITGKPSGWFPSDHWHDIKSNKEMVGYGGLIELFTLFTNDQIYSGSDQNTALNNLQANMYNNLDYLNKLRWGAIMGHSSNYNNPHGTVAADVNLGNIPDFFTATPQQDSAGDRSDLFSTPSGLKRIVDETSPASEDYLIQSEQPFGYYGSGIYLPPPITGSFEGLGSDVENSAFVVEGNGWLVSLFRAFDGRVRNLYYAYNKDYVDRDQVNNPWIDTYVQYQHPTITAAGKSANTVINGSNGQVLMVGDQAEPNAGVAETASWWITASNSTFDPSSHTLKPVDINSLITKLKSLTNVSARPSNFNIAVVGKWVYLMVTVDSFAGDDPENYISGENAANWQTVMFRTLYSNLTDDSVATIVFDQINVSYDTVYRERRNNKNSFIPQKYVLNSSGLITSTVCKYTLPISTVYLNRKKQFIIVPNPNNSRLARIKMIVGPYSTYRNPETGSSRSFQQVLVINFNWDVESNIITIDPNWDMPTYDMTAGAWSNPTTRQKNYAIGSQLWEGIIIGFSSATGSWIPGLGFIIMRSEQTGPPPFRFRTYQINRDRNISRDYEYMFSPNDWTTPAGLVNIWEMQYQMRSPFGVTGFPRLSSDLYALTTGVRASPIEIFTGEDEAQNQQVFYRVTEGGTGDDYIEREALQSKYIPKVIYGRQTNSNFGTVVGLNFSLGYSNRPKRKNSTSRGVGLFSMVRRSIHTNPGSPYEFTNTTKENGNISGIKQESDGSIIINLDMDYTLDSLAKVVTAKVNKAKQVRIPKSVYIDSILSAMGEGDSTTLIDMVVSFYISSTPGTGGDQPYSYWSCIYHTTYAPSDARMVVGMFTWDVASTGSDGIRVLRTVNVQYPFKSIYGTLQELRPGNSNNILISNYYELGTNNTWGINIGFGLQVRQQHMEILDYESEGAQNMEMAWFPGINIAMTGDSATPRIVMRRRNNTIIEASVTVRPIQAFNQYEYVLCANPQLGWLVGINASVSGGAMNLMQPWKGTDGSWDVAQDKYIMYCATYVEGNWSLFINADVLVTFNGYSMNAQQTNWDLRDLTDVYKNQTFYMYCVMNGSSAAYEITKTLRNHNAAHVLVAKIITDDFGIVTIERYQSFSISGFPLTRVRGMGIPVSTGAVTETGTYSFLKRSELYK